MRQSDKESAAIIGFTSAIAAYGAFFIPKSYGTSICLTGGPQAALWAFLVFYLSCIAITWWFYTRPRRAAARHRARRAVARRPRASRPTSRMIGDDDMSHFLDRLTFFKRIDGDVRRRPRHHHQRGPALGGRLSQALAARQDRALHARRQLHRLVLVEDLRQGRHRHLGDAADRLPAHAPRPAQPRAARLLARRQLQLVPLFRQPREISAGALAALEAVARGARHCASRWRPGPPSSRTRRSAPPTPGSAGSAASCARPGTRSPRSSPPPTPTRPRPTAPTA